MYHTTIREIWGMLFQENLSDTDLEQLKFQVASETHLLAMTILIVY